VGAQTRLATHADQDGSWLPVTAILAVVVVVLGTFNSTFLSMVSTWARSDSFIHGFVVFPIVVWLLMQRRTALAGIAPRVSWAGLAWVLLFAAAWYFGSAVRADVIAQAAMMLVIPSAVLAIFGPDCLRVAAYPLFFAMFAVPAGEILLPAMMDITASGAVALLQLSGVPVFHDSWLISIPEGHFQVAEACSGIRYLIACLATTVLFAWQFFDSMKKRFLFIAFSAVFTVLANVTRAYIIILLARWSDMRIAVGVDHFIYGWFLFSVLLVVVFVVGLRYADPPRLAPAAGAMPVFGDKLRQSPRSHGLTAAVVMGLLGGAAALESSAVRDAGDDESVDLPARFAGWRLTGLVAPPVWLKLGSRFETRHVRYDGDHPFQLHLLRSRPGGPDIRVLREYLDAKSVTLVADDLVAAHGTRNAFRQMRLQSGSDRWLIGYWFTLDGRQIANPVNAKIMESVTILAGAHRTPALVAVVLDDGDADGSEEAMRQLVAAVMAELSG